MNVLKSTDSIDCVSCSSVTGLVPDVDLFCRLFSLFFLGMQCLLRIVQRIEFLIALELPYFEV